MKHGAKKMNKKQTGGFTNKPSASNPSIKSTDMYTEKMLRNQMPKASNGVIVGLNGNLSVQGDLVVQGRNILAELNQLNQARNDFYWTLDNNMVRRDKTYEFRDQNQQGRHCIDAGSNGRGCNWDNTWQRFSIVQTPHGKND